MDAKKALERIIKKRVWIDRLDMVLKRSGHYDAYLLNCPKSYYADEAKMTEAEDALKMLQDELDKRNQKAAFAHLKELGSKEYKEEDGVFPIIAIGEDELKALQDGFDDEKA
jgi:hypothetical protein